jgi:hypothetical protein
MEFKNQHLVPQSFLKEWTDPDTPSGYEPYVWLISKDGKSFDNRPPKKILSESDFYTVIDRHGNRILDLENRLSRIENDFFLLKKNKLFKNQQLTDEEFVSLLTFVSTAHARTKWHKESQTELWQDYEKIILQVFPEANGTEFHKAITSLQSQPMPYFLFHFLQILLPTLGNMNLTIYYSDRKTGFITSDNPCLWIDPQLFDPTKPLTFYGAGSPTLNVIMPISPQRVIVLSREWPEGFFSIDDKPGFVDEINSMMVMYSEEVVINNTNYASPYWFKAGKNTFYR